MTIDKIKKNLLSYYKENDNEDLKRKKLILNTLCLSVLSFLILLIILYTYSILSTERDYNNILLILFLYFIVTVIAFVLGRKDKTRASALVLIISMYTCILYGSCLFGIDLPTILLAIFIIVLISGILLDSKSGIVTAILLSIHLFIFNYMERYNIININNTWKFGGMEVDDVIEYSFLLLFAAIISWLNNIQLYKTLDRSKKAEERLIEERNTLDIKVQQKTEEIKKMQIEKINSMYRMVEFGRISSGLFHDIITPLTNINLNVQNLKSTEAEQTLKYLIPSVKKMDLLIQQAKKQIKTDHTIENFCIQNEILSTMELLKSKAIKYNVKLILIENKNSSYINASKTLFSHIITNLISNALDSYIYKNATTNAKPIVIIHIKNKIDKIFIRIIDKGQGIPSDILEKIFEPFFTTKQNHGCGIGLSSTKYIIEKYFSGKITVKSKINQGTTFTVIIPTNINTPTSPLSPSTSLDAGSSLPL